jgi:hypothetical protein
MGCPLLGFQRLMGLMHFLSRLQIYTIKRDLCHFFHPAIINLATIFTLVFNGLAIILRWIWICIAVLQAQICIVVLRARRKYLMLQRHMAG